MASCRFRVVIAKRRLKVHLMFNTEKFYSGRLAEESKDRMKTHLLEELCLLNRLQQGDLLLAGKAGDGGRGWKHLLPFGLRLRQAALVQFLLVLIVARQRAIDKENHVRLFRPRRIAVGNDLRRDRFHLSRARRIEPNELL